MYDISWVRTEQMQELKWQIKSQNIMNVHIDVHAANFSDIPKCIIYFMNKVIKKKLNYCVQRVIA